MMNFRKIAIKLERLDLASRNLSSMKCKTSLDQITYTTRVYHTLNRPGVSFDTMEFKIQALLEGNLVIEKLAKKYHLINFQGK